MRENCIAWSDPCSLAWWTQQLVMMSATLAGTPLTEFRDIFAAKQKGDQNSHLPVTEVTEFKASVYDSYLS